jgi:hypothetical protein
MKSFIFIIVLMGGAFASCKQISKISARPDPNTSTTGTIGSVKATNGALPIGERNAPRPLDTLIAKH